MKLIGIEEHFLTPDVAQAWHAVALEARDPSVAYHQGAIGARLADLADDRLALMDETGLDTQVLSLTTPALHDLGPTSVGLAQRINDALAEAVARHPTRFQAFATLPVSQPEAAARELERCVRELGFKGTMLCGRVGAHSLDAPFFAPIWDRAEALGAPVLIHPRTPPVAVREACYAGFNPTLDAVLATAGLGWHYEAGLQFVRLVLSGLFDRLPRLQVILGHWGELVLFYAERLAVLDRFSGLDHPVAHYLRENLYVTASGMFWPEYLARAARVVGTDRLLFSTDYPYQYRAGREARRFLETCGLEGAALAGFAHANWERLCPA
ncbi:amidohydrolase family protein [Novosphingobium sp. 1949]|uniref:Amidohydrolase family protein n=1 Tax=Novosphingobium organovorum TaxID=2930092 RepID=A0ABT0BD33_9SPHN|nr:amidohydrolase family protein [Novosphingobium organovorum]MCJ2182763.1 amidohydrolase family protein [Novosphingobium organovorum]